MTKRNQKNKSHNLNQKSSQNSQGGPNNWHYLTLLVLALLIAMLYGMYTGDHYYFDKMVDTVTNVLPKVGDLN